MTNKWESFFNGIGLEYIPNEKIFSIGDKKIRPEVFLPQLNCYFSVVKEELREKIVNSEFCRSISGFGLLIAFGEPHDMDMKLFCEAYTEKEKLRSCLSVRFAGYYEASKGKRYINLSLVVNKSDNPRYNEIKGFGYSSESVHAISAYTQNQNPPDIIEKPEIFASYCDADLISPIYERFYIISDYRDHETVRGYGGRWDPDTKMWYMNDPEQRDKCKKALTAIEEARMAEKEAHLNEGWNKVRARAEDINFSSLETKKAVNEQIDKIWKELRDEYKFTKKEIAAFVEENYYG